MQNQPRYNFSPQEQQEIMRFQQIQKSLEALTQQLTTMELHAKDLEHAIAELETAEEEATIYKAVGGLFIKKSKQKMLETSKTDKENLDLRINSLKNQKQRIESQFEEKRKKIEELFKAQGYAS